MGSGVHSAMLIIEFLAVFGLMVYGSKLGGPAGLIAFGGGTTALLVFGLQQKPGDLPVAAMEVILIVTFAAGAMEASGGTGYLLELATRILRRHPSRITFLAPLLTLVLCALAGTGNIFFPFIPVIYETARANGIRPERPLAASVVASQMAVVASPVSASVLTVVALTTPVGGSLGGYLLITVPAILIGVVAVAAVCVRKGEDLPGDPVLRDRPEPAESRPAPGPDNGDRSGPRSGARAKASVWIFLAGVTAIVVLGIFDGLAPAFPDGSRLASTDALLIIEFAVAALILAVGRPAGGSVMNSSTLRGGLTATLVLVAVSWPYTTLINAHLSGINRTIDAMLTTWVGLFVLLIAVAGAIIASQTAIANIFLPLGIAAGLSAPVIAACYMGVTTNTCLPFNGAAQMAIQVDKTGSTGNGRHLVDNSFMVPALTGFVVTAAVAFAMTAIT